MSTRRRELIVWHIKRGMRRLGKSGAAGVVVLLVSAAYYLSTFVPLRDEVSLLKQATLVASASLIRTDIEETTSSPAQQLSEFYSRLKRQGDVPEVVRKLHRMAKAAGLHFVLGDYRPQRDTSGKLLRYQIALPVRGDYSGVRRFIAQALREEPALALDGVGFRTDQSGGGLETRVQFTLFVRKNG